MSVPSKAKANKLDDPAQVKFKEISMSTLQQKGILLFFLITSSIISCTPITPRVNPVIKNVSRLSCSISELDNIMAFGVHFASLSNKQKQIECNQLRFKYNVLDNWISGWSLAYALNEYSKCGTINEGINILKKLRDTKLKSKQIRWLINYQITLFQQLKKVKKLQEEKNLLNQKIKLAKKQLSNCQGEKDSMAQKLLELKSIETSINQRLEEKKNESN